MQVRRYCIWGRTVGSETGPYRTPLADVSVLNKYCSMLLHSAELALREPRPRLTSLHSGYSQTRWSCHSQQCWPGLSCPPAPHTVWSWRRWERQAPRCHSGPLIWEWPRHQASCLSLMFLARFGFRWWFPVPGNRGWWWPWQKCCDWLWPQCWFPWT